MAPSAIFEPVGSFESLITTSKLEELKKSVLRKEPEEKSWPAYMDTPLSWKGPLFSSETEYTYTLSDEEIIEIDRALYLFKALGLDGNEVNSLNFPLPSLARKLESLAHELYEGKGFFVLRGLDPTNHSPEDCAVIYLAVTNYIAEKKGRQNEDGDMFTHIREAKQMPGSQHDRPVRDSTLGLTFHTDTFCDIISLQTLGLSAKGGEHVIASGQTVYNELVATRPDVVQTLASPDWSFDPRCPHYKAGQRSILYYHDRRILFHFVREPLTGFDENCRYKSKSVLSPKQLEALDIVESIAQKHQLVLSMQPGDLTFINNYGVLHSRTAFEDDETHTRHLVRMWLKNEKLAWKLPQALEHGNNIVFGDTPDEENWNILPAPRLSFKIIDLFGP